MRNTASLPADQFEELLRRLPAALEILTGTGPKAGGPLYLRRLLARRPRDTGLASNRVPAAARPWAEWLAQAGLADAAVRFAAELSNTPVGAEQDLAGPVGERNLYGTEARGDVLCVAPDRDELLRQAGPRWRRGTVPWLPEVP